MARKVFFSFHYERDSWRAAQVRNSQLITKENERGFIDKAEWEGIERQGELAIKNWINKQLFGTSVTVVLIGAETAQRKWVLYEIEQSVKNGNGLLGIYINNIKDSSSRIDFKGANPFIQLGYLNVKVYDWKLDNGILNLPKWIEQAYSNQSRDKINNKLISNY